jgi:23S rRNA pseudouridine2605 synthase
VQVNGRVVRELGTKVDPALDKVTVDGRGVRPREKVYLALHKPRGYICSREDADQRPIVLDLLPPDYRHVFPVGRLDYDSEGLIFLTNDGEFALRLTHPRYQVPKRYAVTVAGLVTMDHARQLKHGVWDEGECLRAHSVHLPNTTQGSSRLEIVLTEGKNREVRRMLGVLGFKVKRLLRFQIGPVRLTALPAARWRKLRPSEVRALMANAPAAAPESGPGGSHETLRGARPYAPARRAHGAERTPRPPSARRSWSNRASGVAPATAAAFGGDAAPPRPESRPESRRDFRGGPRRDAQRDSRSYVRGDSRRDPRGRSRGPSRGEPQGNPAGSSGRGPNRVSGGEWRRGPRSGPDRSSEQEASRPASTRTAADRTARPSWPARRAADAFREAIRGKRPRRR